MTTAEATTPAQVERGMALKERYRWRRLRTVEECDWLREWLKAAYLDNPLADPEQQVTADMIRKGVMAVRLDLLRKSADGFRP